MTSSAALIEPQLQRLRDQKLFPHTAAELEFYLHGSSTFDNLAHCYNDIQTKANALGLEPLTLNQESGHEQHEAAFSPCDNPRKTASDIETLKHIITDIAKGYKLQSDFAAKPKSDQPGSGLHLHLHLANGKGHNLFYKDDARISDELKFSIGGLLTWMLDSLSIFAPETDSYLRFVQEPHTPTTVSWGGNNRTCAIRLPDSSPSEKHIELRTCGADANPDKAMAIMLAAVFWGIFHRADPGAQIYGDASLDAYELPKFHSSLEEACAQTRNSSLLAEIFNVEDLLPTV